ncbi:MAG: CheY-like chemotaxis protein [Lentimonas sp.]
MSSTLDYTRIETDRLYLTETVFSPLKAIKQCIEAAKEETIEKDLMLQLDYQGISPYVLGDERCFTLVIENLIDRALDQTSVGGIRITVSQHAMRRKTILHLEIRDSGSGWSLAESQNLFELQNKPATETQIPDLGTLISERIITKMGGRLQCTHEEDQGSLVTLDLPFKIPAESPKSEEPPKTEEPPKSEASKARQQTTADPQIQLLVVDDKRINLEIVTRHLATLNCKTHSASNGMEALKKLRTLQIDYIFMECRMSELSGFETTELIRAGECGKHNENIFITGMAAQLSDSVRKNGTAAGMNHFIAKPVNQDSIEVALSAWRDDQTKDAIPCRNSEAN